MLVPICVQPICVIFIIGHKYSVPLQHQRNWCQPTLPAARRPPRFNGGATVPVAYNQPSIRTNCPVSIGSTQPTKPANPDPLYHFLTNTPSSVSLICPSKPFSNRHANPIPVRHSRHSSTDYLSLQAILEPTHQSKSCDTVP